jgi:hypothetical protein
VRHGVHIERLCAAARSLKLAPPATSAVEAALGYFDTNTERKRYASYRPAGHSVGSGPVESDCKTVIGQHLKLSGMRWNEHGASGILALRCQQASGRRDQICQRLHNQTNTT